MAFCFPNVSNSKDAQEKKETSTGKDKEMNKKSAQKDVIIIYLSYSRMDTKQNSDV